jgi:hypothetical protein
MPEGHRVFAARSVLDGREHDGSLRQEGAKSISLPTSTRLQQPASDTPSARHASQVKRSSAICVRVFTAANRWTHRVRLSVRFEQIVRSGPRWPSAATGLSLSRPVRVGAPPGCRRRSVDRSVTSRGRTRRAADAHTQRPCTGVRPMKSRTYDAEPIADGF